MFVPPKPVRAAKTLEAINLALEADQGALFRKLLRNEMPLAEDAYRGELSPFRAHLGASIIGRECARALWYQFHWATATRHPGRMLRLFNRGHLEEPRFIALLKMIGCQVWNKNEQGKQFKISDHGGHYGGSLDGVGLGIPDDPEIPMLLEFKTHSDKNFGKVSNEGVRSAKFEHFVQMISYMGGYQLTKGLYLVVNKDNDDLYGEIVTFDPEQYARFNDRALRIITSEEPPAKINESPGWYTCKFCDFKGVCHNNVEASRNCRTCVHSTLGDNGTWICTRHNVSLSEQAQLAGCPDYRWRPKL